MRKKFRFIFISTIYLADAACGQHSPRAQFIHVVRISVPLRCVQMRRRQKSSAIPNLLSVKWLNGADVDFQLCSHYIFEDTCRSTSQPTHPIRWLCARPWRALRFSSFFSFRRSEINCSFFCCDYACRVTGGNQFSVLLYLPSMELCNLQYIVVRMEPESTLTLT